MSNQFIMNSADLAVIAEILKDNSITGNFYLIHDDTSGIGYTIDLEYETHLNGRKVKVTVPVCTAGEW